MGLKKSAIFFLALSNALSVIGMTLITPSLPMIKVDFNISAETTQLVLTFYLIFVSLGQMLCGTLSDRFGRRPVLLLGSLLYLAGGVCAMYSPSIEYLLAFRIIQAIGAAACLAMARVIVNDSFKKEEAAEKLSLITAVMVIFPNIALILGGAIAETLGWRGSMGTLFIFGTLLFLGSLILIPETIKEKTHKLKFEVIFNSYLSVIKNPLFLNYALISAIQSGIFFSLFSFMPYQFYRLGVSPLEFGFWLSFCGVGYFFGNIVNRNFASIIGISKMCLIGCVGSSIALIIMILLYILNFSHPLSISIPCFLFGFGNGITVANALIGAISSCKKNSGTATGVAGAMAMASGGIFGSIIIGIGGAESFFTAVIFIIILSIIGIYFSILTFKNDKKISKLGV